MPVAQMAPQAAVLGTCGTWLLAVDGGGDDRLRRSSSCDGWRSVKVHCTATIGEKALRRGRIRVCEGGAVAGDHREAPRSWSPRRLLRRRRAAPFCGFGGVPTCISAGRTRLKAASESLLPVWVVQVTRAKVGAAPPGFVEARWVQGGSLAGGAMSCSLQPMTETAVREARVCAQVARIGRLAHYTPSPAMIVGVVTLLSMYYSQEVLLRNVHTYLLVIARFSTL